MLTRMHPKSGAPLSTAQADQLAGGIGERHCGGAQPQAPSPAPVLKRQPCGVTADPQKTPGPPLPLPPPGEPGPVFTRNGQ